MPWVKMTSGKYFGFNYNSDTKEFKVFGVLDKEPEILAIRPTDPNLFTVELREDFKQKLHNMLEEEYGKIALEEIGNINTVEDISRIFEKTYPPLYMDMLYDEAMISYGDDFPHIESYEFEINPK